jgi:hypothetical protein
VISNGLVPPDPGMTTRRLPSPNGPPRFVYVGVIAPWFDWEAVLALARRFPASPIRLIGPCHQAPPSALPSNVQLLGPLAHQALDAVFLEADIGLIPFLDKFYEYRAAGLGVLSTRFGTMNARGPSDQVLFFDAQPSAPALRALAQAAADEAVRARFCAEHAWTRRWERLAPWFTAETNGR